MDDEDVWFFSSIKRYNQLQMFDFDKSAQEMELSSQNNLCVGLEPDRKNKCEVLICSLPNTLELKSGNNDVKFDRHLSFNRGYFTDAPLIQMKCFPNEEHLIISEVNQVGIYDLTSEDTDLLQKIATIPCSIPRAKIAVHPQSSYVALTGDVDQLRSIVDYSSLKPIFDITNDSEKGEIIPLFSSYDTISFANNVHGSLSMYDIHNQILTGCISIPDLIEITRSARSRWVFSNTYGIKNENPNFNDKLLYFLSTNGNFLIYDRRNLKEFVHYSKHSFDIESKMSSRWNLRLSICPSDLNKFLLCGFDENVYVCELKNGKVEVIFTHDGHPYSKDEFECNVTTVCSMWIPFFSSNTVASCADNTSLQCWQFLLN